MPANNLNMVKVIDTGGVLSDIVGESSSTAVVLEIEQALGIDSDFPAARNLVETLQNILQPLCSDSPTATAWLDALRVVQQSGQSRKGDLLWARLAPTGHAGNPVGGYFKQYPILAFFLQEPMADAVEQVSLIHRLLLAVLIQRKDPRGLNSIADTLRKLIARTGPQSSLHRLPRVVSTEWEVLGSALENLPEDDLLAARLRTLLKMVNTTGTVRPALTSLPLATTPTGSPTIGGASRPMLGGLVRGHSIQVVEPGNKEIAEPPKYVDLHIADPDANEEGEPASEVEVNASSRETRYWVSRHQRITPNDAGRLTAIERRWLATTLRELIQSEDSNLRVGAGLVALMYVTGMQFELLINSEVGPAGGFDVGGVYRRTIRVPTNAYTPDPELIDQFLPRESVLCLQLPTVLSPWMDAHVRPTKGTLLKSLGIDIAEANERVDSVMQLLRANGRYTRIRRERIPAALAIELNLKYRDFGLVHHLASNNEQVAPMINYYVSHFIEDLKRRYSEVVGAMLLAQ